FIVFIVFILLSQRRLLFRRSFDTLRPILANSPVLNEPSSRSMYAKNVIHVLLAVRDYALVGASNDELTFTVIANLDRLHLHLKYLFVSVFVRPNTNQVICLGGQRRKDAEPFRHKQGGCHGLTYSACER